MARFGPHFVAIHFLLFVLGEVPCFSQERMEICAFTSVTNLEYRILAVYVKHRFGVCVLCCAYLMGVNAFL